MPCLLSKTYLNDVLECHCISCAIRAEKAGAVNMVKKCLLLAQDEWTLSNRASQRMCVKRFISKFKVEEYI
jgi:hypothetical protein